MESFRRMRESALANNCMKISEMMVVELIHIYIK